MRRKPSAHPVTARRSAARRPAMVVVFTGMFLATLAVWTAPARGQMGMARGVTFVGPIETLPSSGLIGDWKVGGVTVHVAAQTTVDQGRAAAAVGAFVKVEGTLESDRSVAASAIVVESAGRGGPPAGRPGVVVGQVEGLPASGLIGDWTVHGVNVHVATATVIDQSRGTVAVGATVLVRGLLQGDGSIDAQAIDVLPQPGPGAGSVSFCGAVSALPASGVVGDWTVSGVTVHVGASTTVDQSRGAAALDVSVRVTGVPQPDASVNATEIVVDAPQCSAVKAPAAMTFSVLHLRPTSAAPPDAGGVALTRQMTFPDGTTREDLKVAVEHLSPKTAYEVVIDGTDAGPIMTDADGDGMLFLSTADIPGAEPLPSALQDFSKLVELDVDDPGGTAVLSGKFADARSSDREGGALDYLAVAVLKNPSSQVVGMAAASIRGTTQELSLAAWGLTAGQTYTLQIDGTTAGTLVASARGRIGVEYSSAPMGEDVPLPDALKPVSGLMHVEIQDSGGAAVVSGDLQAIPNPAVSPLKRLVKRNLHH